MFRFSQDRRFTWVSYPDFVSVSARLSSLVWSHRGSVDARVMTCEDMHTYNFSTVTFASDDVTEALRARKSYTPNEFTFTVWERSLKVQLLLTDPSSTEPFMICVSIDRHADAKRMEFYGQVAGDTLEAWVKKAFAHSTTSYSIGDGLPKISNFNFAFGQRITGLRI